MAQPATWRPMAEMTDELWQHGRILLRLVDPSMGWDIVALEVDDLPDRATHFVDLADVLEAES